MPKRRSLVALVVGFGCLVKSCKSKMRDIHMPLHTERRDQTARQGVNTQFNDTVSTSSQAKTNGHARANDPTRSKLLYLRVVNRDVALKLASIGIYIFPAEIVLQGDRWLKKPLIKDWQHKATTDSAQIYRWWKRFPHAVAGIELGRSGYVVLDADRHGGPDGVALFAELVAQHGGLPAHPITKTPGDGEHHVFRQVDGEPFGNGRGALPDGIDVRGRGGWIVAPGAVRPDGRPWELTPDSPSLADTPPLPEWLATIIHSRPKPPPQDPPPTPDRPRDTSWSTSREGVYARQALRGIADEIRRTPPNTRRNECLNAGAYRMGRMVARGWIDQTEVVDDLSEAAIASGLPVDEVQNTLGSGLTAGLQNPAEDLEDRPRHSRARARQGGKEQARDEGTRQQKTEKTEAPRNKNGFSETASGAIAKSEGNIRLALTKASIKLSYDSFARQRIIRGLPGYGPDLTDAAIDAMWIRFEREHRVRFSREHFNAVIRVEAHANSFHPVRDYLASTKWDDKPRLDKWLINYAGAEDTELNQQFSRLSLIAAVRRIRKPGTKFDAMLVLEGPEGRNKSSLFEVLASPEWFSDDAPLNADARETIERLRGKWIIEAADLSAVKRTDVERLKAFLSRNKDTATLKFERETTTALRECVFVGTTNSSEYLQSKTGNRRFWPVKIGKIDLAALRKDRDQIWAEAAHAEAKGASHMLPEKFWDIAAAEQEKRRESDAWEGAIAIWLEERRERTDPLVSAAEVASSVLSVQLRDLDGASQRRITEAMRLAGWSKDAGKTVQGVHLWGPREGR